MAALPLRASTLSDVCFLHRYSQNYIPHTTMATVRTAQVRTVNNIIRWRGINLQSRKEERESERERERGRECASEGEGEGE